MNQTSASLYIHIPFCKSKCAYCAFYSQPVEEHWDKLRQYIDRILADTRKFLDIYCITQVPSIFIGGGTPNILPDSILSHLLTGLSEIIPNKPREVSIEANPEYITKEQLATLQTHGITRLSIGIQSTQKDILRIIGRTCGLEEAESGLSIIRNNWTLDLNLDFIADIPGQSEEAVLSDVARIKKIAPDHVSIYCLDTADRNDFHQRLADRHLSPEEPPDTFSLYKTELRKAGYQRYEISNFAKPGKECLHNLGYWRLDPYIGIGPGAVSTVFDYRLNKPMRICFPASIDEFTFSPAAGRMGTQDILSTRDFLYEHFIMGLRIREGVNFSQLSRRFGDQVWEIQNKLKADISSEYMEFSRSSCS
ncbi:MAG: radical SAM family heme chaperone HemW, partial [Spirochaetia bacterium]